MGFDHVLVLDTEGEFYHPVLMGLKPGTLTQGISETEVIHRGHGRQHIPRLGQLLLNPGDPGNHFHGRIKIILSNTFHGGSQFMEGQFHPEFGRLVNDDKHHFIMFV